MTLRSLWLLLAWACLGCQSVVPLDAPPDEDLAAILWQKGQDAMRRGQSEQAVLLYERSLELDPTLVRTHLSLAAAYLEQGDDDAACSHLGLYVRSHPDQIAVRIHLADLHLRLRRLTEARREFESCVACAQERSDPAYGSLLHCHSRLMEIAEETDDSYREHLHRGIGLCLLARQRSILPDPEGELPMESLLCKAAGELTQAHAERPEEARPNWYLADVWTMLDQRAAARRCLRDAVAAAPFSDLTAAEQRCLHLRCDCVACDAPRK